MFMALVPGYPTYTLPLARDILLFAVHTLHSLVNVIAIKHWVIAVHNLPTSCVGTRVEGRTWPRRLNNHNIIFPLG